jgi:hypothetical protein
MKKITKTKVIEKIEEEYDMICDDCGDIIDESFGDSYFCELCHKDICSKCLGERYHTIPDCDTNFYTTECYCNHCWNKIKNIKYKITDLYEEIDRLEQKCCIESFKEYDISKIETIYLKEYTYCKGVDKYVSENLEYDPQEEMISFIGDDGSYNIYSLSYLTRFIHIR